GADFADEISIFSMRPLAMALWISAPYASCGRANSAANVARPVTLSLPSARASGWPMSAFIGGTAILAVGHPGVSPGGQFRFGRQDVRATVLGLSSYHDIAATLLKARTIARLASS